MAGEIHGIISREDAGRMWKPYGERAIDELDGLLDPDNITPMEAVNVTLGSNPDMQWKIKGKVDPERTNPKWFAQVKTIAEKGIDEEFVKLLVESNDYQNTVATAERQRAINEGLAFVGLLRKATVRLVQEGFLTHSEATSIQDWMIGPDGLPNLQYTPMSQLEYARLALKYDKEEPALNTSDYTDFNLGILCSTVGLRPVTAIISAHNKVHESVHGNFSGVEIWDITREDGWRGPEATVVGHFAYEPSTKVVAGDDFSAVENCEINEGWTDFLARELMRVEPKLGAPLGNVDGYGAWTETIGEIKKYTPKLFRAITKAALVETGPSNPHAKREVLADLHDYSDRVLGQPNSLAALFQGRGGSILDIFTKGKAKAKATVK